MKVNESEDPPKYVKSRSIMSLDPLQFQRHDAESFEDLRPAVRSRASSYLYISSKYESLDYCAVESKIIIEDLKTKSYSYFVNLNAFRILNFFFAALLIAVIGAFLDFAITDIGYYKYKFMSIFIDNNYSQGLNGHFLFIIIWYSGIVIPVILSSSLVVFIAPYAAGGGVAQTIGYLNGVRVPNLLTIRGLFVKLFSTILTCTSGLAGGKEGPMLHMGAIVASRFPDFLVKIKPLRWYQNFQNDRERRDLAAAGFAAGLACAFNAPIGGLLLAVEEGISYWNIDLMWKIFVCTITSVFFIILIMSIIEGAPGYFNNPELLTLGKIDEETTQYEYFEIIYFILVGLVGGLLGPLLIYLHMHLTYIRQRFVNTRVRKLTESLATACLVGSLSIIAVMSYQTCRNVEHKVNAGGHAANKTVGQIYCNDGHYSVMTLLTYQNQDGLIHIMFSPVADDVEFNSLVILFFIYFVNLNLTMGLSLSAGVFVPQIVFGSIWGRIFGLIIRSIHKNAKWAAVSKYAYLGAAAQLSGAIRKTFSVMVIMIEASGNIGFGIPLMLVVTTVRIVGNFFTMPLYELQAHMMGIPLLYNDPPPLSKEIKADEVMSPPPTAWLPLVSQVREILFILERTKHNGFPVVQTIKKEAGFLRLRGLILRHDLLVMLKYKMYKYPTPTTTKEFVERWGVFKDEVDRDIGLETLEIREIYFNATIDLSPYMNPYPYTRNETSSLANVYQLFRSIGLRHIVILSDSNEVVGVVTRKDLAKYHVWEHLCMMGVKELGLRIQ